MPTQQRSRAPSQAGGKYPPPVGPPCCILMRRIDSTFTTGGALPLWACLTTLRAFFVVGQPVCFLVWVAGSLRPFLFASYRRRVGTERFPSGESPSSFVYLRSSRASMTNGDSEWIWRRPSFLFLFLDGLHRHIILPLLLLDVFLCMLYLPWPTYSAQDPPPGSPLSYISWHCARVCRIVPHRVGGRGRLRKGKDQRDHFPGPRLSRERSPLTFSELSNIFLLHRFAGNPAKNGGRDSVPRRMGERHFLRPRILGKARQNVQNFHLPYSLLSRLT